MANKVQDLVKAIQEGKSSAIQSTFDAAVAEKVQYHIEHFRAQVLESTFNESTSYDANLGKDKTKPVYAEGVKGVKSKPFKKKFKSQAHFEKWADSDDFGDHEVHRVYNESEIGEAAGEFEEIEEENLEEISAKTLGSYVKKASVDAANLQATAGAFRTAARLSQPKARKFHTDNAARAAAKSGKRLDGISTAVQKMTEEEEIDELSGATLGSYVQKARKDIDKRRDHDKALEAVPKVATLKQKLSDLYAEKRFDKKGNFVNRPKIDKTTDAIAAAKKKLDPNYPKSISTHKRRKGIDKAIDKLQYGKMTEEVVKQPNNETGLNWEHEEN